MLSLLNIVQYQQYGDYEGGGGVPMETRDTCAPPGYR